MCTKKKLIKSEKNLNELFYKLNNLFYFLDNTYEINSGGCCFVASVLARLFEKDGIKFSVIVYDCEYDNFYDIDCSQYHYTLRFGEKILNAYDDNEYSYSEFFNICAKDLEEHYKECDWNECYNSKHNDYIKRIIKNFYNDFTKNFRKCTKFTRKTRNE